MSRMSLSHPIMRRKEIIMWIRLCPNWNMSFNSKKWWKKSIFYETKVSTSFILMRRMSLWFLIMKRKEIFMWIVFVLIYRWTLILKNSGKKSILNETKASMTFILMRKMGLWCPFIKGKEIIMWTRVCPNWQTKFNSKKC